MKLKSLTQNTSLILFLIWLLGAVSDRLWFSLDHSVPAWDQAEYLNTTLNYWQALQSPEWFNGTWWRNFWLLTTKTPPLTSILTVPFLNLFGLSADSATLVMLFFSAFLLVSVYLLGLKLFNRDVGLIAAALCLLLPGLYRYRLDFLLDFPLTTIVTVCFCFLTYWKLQPNFFKAILFGLSLGIGLIIKQTSLFFIFLPLVWVGFGALFTRKWGQILQLLAGLFSSVLIFGWWYRTNWLLILTGSKRATIDSAIAEGDPALNTLDAWTYYPNILPYLLSWSILLIPIVGLIFYTFKLSKNTLETNTPLPIVWRWLAVFLIGGYFLSSLNINKDHRYILPLLGVLSVGLAAGLQAWFHRWRPYLVSGTLGLGWLLMMLNIFPLPGQQLTQIFSPKITNHPYTGEIYPHPEVVKEIIQTSPYTSTTLGVLPSTPEINQHNFSFYGSLANFQVSGRQVGVRKTEVEQDARSLDWFITKTGEQGSIPSAQEMIVKLVEGGADFRLQKSWELPDKTLLKLYRHQQLVIAAQPVATTETQVKLAQVKVPQTTPAGIPTPVTYEWVGPLEQLKSGIVILSWENDDQTASWLHDHGIALGTLVKNPTIANLQVTENLAMFPPGEIPPGDYSLKATYLNRKTKETYSIEVPAVTLKIDPAAPATPAPELDLITQLRRLAPGLSLGRKGLDPIFAQTARINQYDPVQDYLSQADLALSHRLASQPSHPDKLNWAYTIGLARVLRQDVEGAINAFKEVVRLDSQNPFAHMYLAFVYLYDWRGHEAGEALKPALALNTKLPELEALDGIAALMQGNLLKAWNLLSKNIPLIK